jgi:hypothetical protein
MADDYLWDRSGEPDPEVERLERVLGRLRSVPRPLELPSSRVVPMRRRWWGSPLPLGAVAAAVILALAAGWVVTRPVTPAWEVAWQEGGAQSTRRLRAGEWLETSAASRARLRVGKIGHVDLEPNTLLGLVSTRLTNHRLALRRGEISARIWAPPRLFFVETPSALATDLGCAYNLKVDEDGASILHVSHGWVSFELAGRESLVPEGASCVTRPGIGPGTPYYVDASEDLRSALARFDFEGGGSAALDVVLRESRRRDALTLWHLLSRTTDVDRGRVYDRLASLVEVPEGVNREAVVAGDKRVLQLWWDELGLEEAGWWR